MSANLLAIWSRIEHTLGGKTTRRQYSLLIPRLIGRLLLHLVVAVGGFALLIPFFWMVSTAVKPEQQIFLYPPKWIPEPILWRNFLDVLRPQPLTATGASFMGMNFLLNLRNTSIITAANIVGSLLSCSLVAFGFARLRARGKDLLFMIVLASMMLPWPVLLIPQFLLFYHLKWVDTFLPLTVPSFFGIPFFIFLLRQFFMTLPRELDDAARIDGCSTFRLFWAIILPLSKPVLTTIAIFSFMTHWNDFLGPLVYLNHPNKFTLALGLRAFQTSFRTRFDFTMAASTLVMLPCLLVFFFLQRYFIQGIVVYGIKG